MRRRAKRKRTKDRWRLVLDEVAVLCEAHANGSDAALAAGRSPEEIVALLKACDKSAKSSKSNNKPSSTTPFSRKRRRRIAKRGDYVFASG